MKTTFACLLLILAGTIASQAQTFADVFEDETEIVWLGLDYTEVKIVGDEASWGDRTPQQMYETWNQLMINEAPKYNVAEALHKKKDKVINAVHIALEHNNALRVNNSDVFKNSPSPAFRLSSEKINNIVKSYDFRDNKGIGFMIIMETLDKSLLQSTMWATFIDLNTKEVLFTQQMISPPGGFGLRNFWASSIYDTLNKIKGVEYRNWYKAYKKESK